MYCFKCGKQIRDDSVFCQYCGTQMNNASSDVAVAQSGTSSSNRELDRDALKIYLSNILSLECIKTDYNRRISNCQYSIKKAQNSSYYQKYHLRGAEGPTTPHYVHFLYNGRFNLAWCAKGSGGSGLYMYRDLGCLKHEWRHWVDDSSIEFLRKPYQWEDATDYSASRFTKMVQREEARDAFFLAYSDFKSTAPSIYQKNLETNRRNISMWQNQITGMTKELQEINQLLKQAYDINIIPSQFRYNIHAIYYLHDFVSTSLESLTTALLHFDLDEIKAKLDNIIAQQESIIIQNAVMIAQNEKLVKQNQQQLEQLSKIESNTSRASQYSQIAANNAKICALISMANYIEAHR